IAEATQVRKCRKPDAVTVAERGKASSSKLPSLSELRRLKSTSE
ncbi:hypothetical protein A2U01_0082662, partial [Trifolium medium]|nr:hypothetical protein [Trifolium medium]